MTKPLTHMEEKIISGMICAGWTHEGTDDTWIKFISGRTSKDWNRESKYWFMIGNLDWKVNLKVRSEP